MFNFSNFYQLIAEDIRLQPWLNTLPQQLTNWQNMKHRDFESWLYTLKQIQEGKPDNIDLKKSVSLSNNEPLTQEEFKELEKLLKTLRPWRKGPYKIHNIHIDAEWKSDWKWDRILPHISPLKNRLVLDVGCGNGYYMWRMIGEEAKLCIGIDPSRLFFVQFETIRKLLGNNQRSHLVPLNINQLPKLKAFDTVFSMGTLYHRRSPLDHLIQLKDQLVSDGELVLETLVVEGNETTALVPSDRYAQMRNVYFFPSTKALKIWLERTGFKNVRIVDENITTTKEQRTTEWMQQNSLYDYLSPNNPTKTIEGHPAPKRATLIANKV
ncbi:tRNA (mo5U34)-methyltransferase [Candidatus Photodesmus blepharus]|uniref:tRNA U34 carboxymethyltransferase n=1 Tax=Candidatus Photodesmus blepharonis TaxID=1179155 RepID=A0A084CP92_9GAMM|nr:tRNA 5-methoxyuridine(34)/uridine 5-oxyacetic acid(34) synthase CmoB [Candidatus Photodesmus blepharus]KEY91621.1 tRNA (mo5U34)-methyltransferase [Candidatus Photodesmus blepharus]